MVRKPIVEVRHATMWRRACNFARKTIGKKPIDHEPSRRWIARILLAEHSPIRTKEYDIDIEGCRTWVFGHLVRHWLGFLPFIHSQRSDRRKSARKRDELPQGELNDGSFAANAQALINISRKRLCGCASPETREAWQLVKDKVREIDPVMADKMVPDCVYRGRCYEFEPCGYCGSKAWTIATQAYRRTDYEDEPGVDPETRDKTHYELPKDSGSWWSDNIVVDWLDKRGLLYLK